MNRKLKKGSEGENDARTVEVYKADFDALIEGRLLAGWVR